MYHLTYEETLERAVHVVKTKGVPLGGKHWLVPCGNVVALEDNTVRLVREATHEDWAQAVEIRSAWPDTDIR